MENIYQKVQGYAGIFSSVPAGTPTNAEPDGPLCGNGDIGIAAGMENGAATFWIGKNDFWYTNCTDPAARISGVKCFGKFSFYSEPLRDASFSARQELATADIEINLENEKHHLRLRVYTPYQRSLIVAEAQAVKGDIPLEIQLKPLEEIYAVSTSRTEGNILTATKEYIGEKVAWETKGAAYGQILGWDRRSGVLCEGERATFVISVKTNHDCADYPAQAEAEVKAAAPEKLDQYRAEHLAWWKEFWNTSGISISSEPDVEKFWYASHYLLACCKEGKFAPGLFGNWITTNKPNWGSDYHLNYNYQAPWWGVFSSNKVELAAPYDKTLMDYIPIAQRNAREDAGCRGIYAKTGVGPLGVELNPTVFYNEDGTVNHELPYLGQRSNAAYAAVNMVMRFYSTWDKEYARKYALPYLREVADFWEDYLKFEDGRYVIYNDCVHENSILILRWQKKSTEGFQDHSDDFNPILTLGLLRLVFRGLLDISEYLGEDEGRREKWNHILTHLSDFPLQEREGKTVFRYTERGMDWCDGNSLGIQHIFPSGCIGLSSDEKMLQIARDTITVMHRWSDYNAFPTFFTAAARVGYDPEIILSKFKEQFLNHSFPNLFVYYGGGGIECCSAVPSCINEMLFQSHEGVLRFFPVWDQKKDASFNRLRGYGAFVVSAELKNGVVGEIDLESEQGRPCSILCPWESGMTVLEDGKPVPCQIKEIRDGQVYTFETKAGGVYKVQPARS